jgi:hypothetical protein
MREAVVTTRLKGMLKTKQNLCPSLRHTTGIHTHTQTEKLSGEMNSHAHGDRYM